MIKIYEHFFKYFVLMLFTVLAFSVFSEETSYNDELDRRIYTLKNKGHFPGVALAIIKSGVPTYIRTYGEADISNNTPVSSKTVFELASLTKQMTALAIMTLVEEEQLSIESKLVTYVKDAPKEWENITVNQLLSHTAGLSHRFEETVNGTLLLDYSVDDMLTAAKQTPMHAKPGTDWNYSDQGYFLLGIIIEAVSRKTFAEYMHTKFFKPLGMSQTHLLDQKKVVPYLAQGYALKNGEIERNRRVWQFGLTSHFGVMSSLDDMVRWEAELANPSVINRKALEATWKLQRTFDSGDSCESWGYSRGWQAHTVEGRRILSHGGYSGTAYIRAVDHNFSIIVLTNREDTQDSLSPFALGWAAANFIEPTINADGLRCWE